MGNYTPIDAAVAGAWQNIGKRDWEQETPTLHPVPEGSSTLEQHQAKVAREDSSNAGTYLGAMWRQDSWVDGFLAKQVGTHMAPDPSYNPYEKAEWEELADGVWPEYQKELAAGTSQASARYIKELILQKQSDLTHLGDMGALGNSGRLLFNLVEPTSIVAGMAGGYVAKGAGIARVVAGMGRAGRAAAGIATGAGFNAGFEKVRQANNFEDSTAGVIEAGLMGAAFTAPFALRGALRPKEIEKLSKTATRELGLLEATKKAKTADLYPEAHARAVQEAELQGAHVDAFRASLLDPEQFPDPVETPSAKLKRYNDAFDAIEVERVAGREKDLTQVWGEGQLHKGDEMDSIQAVLDRANGPRAPKGPMEEAFARAFGKQRKRNLEAEAAVLQEAPAKAPQETVKSSEGDAKAAFERGAQEAPKPTEKAPMRENPVEVGEDVFWQSHDGDFEAGLVVGTTRQGKLIVEDASSGSKRVVSREDLDAASPGWRERPYEGTIPAPTAKREPSFLDSSIGLTEYDVAQLVEKSVSSWSVKPSVRVITRNNPPPDVRLSGDTYGFVHRNEIYIVSDMHRTPLDVEMTLFHEAFHLGVRRMLPQGEYVIVMNNLRERNPALAKLADAYLEKYKGEWEAQGFDPSLHSARSLEESLAEMAEKLDIDPSLRAKAVVWVVNAVSDLMRAMHFNNLADWLQTRVPVEAVKFVRTVLSGLREGGLSESPYHTPQGWIDYRRTLAAEPKLEHGVALSKWRIDSFSQLMKSPNEIHQKLAHILVKDAIGDTGGTAQPMTASEAAWLLKRTVAFPFHREAKDAFNEARKARGLSVWKAGQLHTEFYEATTRLARGDASVLQQHADIAPQLQKSATALRRVFDTMAEKAAKAGVQGAENLKTGSYIPRIWNHNNIREAISTHGRENVVRALSDAIKVPGLTGDVSKAGAFLSAVSKTEFSHGMQDLQLQARDMATLRAELGDPKLRLTQQEVDAVVDVMFGARKGAEGDAGNTGHLKYRFDIDENHALQMPNGDTFRISDLFENDSRLVADRYMQSMSGHVAMAERGFSSRADFMAALREAEDFHEANHSLSEDAGRFSRDHQLLMDFYDHTIGKPMSSQSFNRMDRFLGAWRAYGRSAFLGQLGVASAFEMKNAIAMTSSRVFWQHSGGFRGLIQGLRTGRIPEPELAKSIEAMTGAGLERVAAYARQHELTDFTYDRGLSTFENFSNKASHAVDTMSGNAFFTAYTRHLSAAMFIQKHLDLAHGKGNLDDATRARLAAQGLDAAHLQGTLDDLKTYTRSAPDGKALEIRWEDWAAQQPESYSRFQTVLSREIREAIQDHDIGETPPWIHSTLGKIVAELRTFMLAAHSKQFLKGLHYKDRTTAMQWMWAFTGEMLAYSVQTSINYAHNPQELEKRLTLDKIAAAAVGRMGVLGVVPMMLETPYVAVTGQKLFGSGTVNTSNRDLLQTPSYVMFQRLRDTGLTGLEALGIGPKQAITQDEARATLGLLPGGNLWVMRNLADAITHDLPKQ